MSRVVPSQAVELIDSIFPQATQKGVSGDALWIASGQSEKVAVIVAVVEQIPSDLLTLGGEDYVAFASGLTTLKHALEMWPTRGSQLEIRSTPGFGNLSPITLIRRTLAKCADTAPVVSTAELAFIKDKDFRDSLRVDVSTAHTALANGEWKPATVVAGSVVEALLLWALLREQPSDISASRTKLLASMTLTRDPGADLLKWTLHPLIEVARDRAVINPDTAAQCSLGRDFRNLIHPGRAARLKTQCTRGTALSAVAAMERVIEGLQ